MFPKGSHSLLSFLLIIKTTRGKKKQNNNDKASVRHN